jgi:hypothetical protein
MFLPVLAWVASAAAWSRGQVKSACRQARRPGTRQQGGGAGVRVGTHLAAVAFRGPLRDIFARRGVVCRAKQGRNIMRILVMTVLALLCAWPARAQQAPVTIVVNFVAGGPSDLMARLLAPELSAALGVPFVVKNTVGAAGVIGAAEVARARPDGQTILLSPLGAMVIQPNFRTDMP